MGLKAISGFLEQAVTNLTAEPSTITWEQFRQWAREENEYQKKIAGEHERHGEYPVGVGRAEKCGARPRKRAGQVCPYAATSTRKPRYLESPGFPR